MYIVEIETPVETTQYRRESFIKAVAIFLRLAYKNRHFLGGDCGITFRRHGKRKQP